MGLFNNRLTRWLNRDKDALPPVKKYKYMYEVSAKLTDQGRGVLDIKIKVPANNKRGAESYFNDNVKLEALKIIQDRRRQNRKNHVKSMGKTRY